MTYSMMAITLEFDYHHRKGPSSVGKFDKRYIYEKDITSL